MFNKVIMAGNLTADPSELKEVMAGNAVSKVVCTFRIAANSRLGGGKEKALFISVETWEGQAKACHAHLKKGSKVLVDGRLDEEQWEKEGKKHSKMKIVANTVTFLGGGRPDEGQGNNEGSDVEPF